MDTVNDLTCKNGSENLKREILMSKIYLTPNGLPSQVWMKLRS